MPDRHDNSTVAEASVCGSSADLQRAALRDLLVLSTECAEAEARIEREYRSAKQTCEGRFHKATKGILRRHQALKAAAERRCQEQIERVRTRWQHDLADANSGLAEARERIGGKAQSTEEAIKQDLQNAIWMAESVFEAEQNSLHQSFERTREAVAVHLASLNAMQKQTEELLRRYHQRPVPVPEPAAGKADAGANPETSATRQRDRAKAYLEALGALKLAKLFVGLRPYGLLVLLCGASAAGAMWLAQDNPNRWNAVGIAAGGTFVVALVLGLLLRHEVKTDVRALYVPLCQAIAAARRAAERQLELARVPLETKRAEATRQRDQAIAGARKKYEPVLAKVARLRDESLNQARNHHAEQVADIQRRRDRGLRDARRLRSETLGDLERRYDRYLAMANDRHERQSRDFRSRYESDRAALERRWREGMARIEALVRETERLNRRLPGGWDESVWTAWSPPERFSSEVRFGQLHVDTHAIARGTLDKGRFRLRVPAPFPVPAMLTFPKRGSLLIQSDRQGRAQAIRTLQMLTARLLTALPPGRVRFTIIDPLELGQNFSGFMHLADHDESLVGTRIWTDSEHIEQRLSDLTEHMENVFQKYLRNEFATIDDYNAQAGELAEPYRYLVIADFPVNFNEQAARRLSSIVTSGARCGVYTLIALDTRRELPEGIQREDLEASCINLVQQEGRFVWNDEVFGRFPLELDAPPPETLLTRILHAVGRRAVEAGRVEVPFNVIAPADGQYWTRRTDEDLRVPIGRTGATRLQELRLGRGVAQHALIAGKTGSGKSTLLHVLVTNLALWYGPDQVEFYLVDFKKGVEFKTYAIHELPHAQAVAIESDREFGVSVLQRVDAEMTRRGELYRQYHVQDLASYRRAAGPAAMPRTLLIVDEFQEFFSEDDKLAQDATLLLDRLVRQGRAFGIHVLLGSQSLAGTSGLARSTVGQMAVRIALQCSEADSQLILSDDNTAARLLSRPGEAIYNDAGGLVDGNSPFQVAWLPDQTREDRLARVSELARQRWDRRRRPIVFEGNAPAEIDKNQQLAALLESPDWPAAPTAPRAWLGEPITIKEPTSVSFRRQSGANLLIVGQRDDAAVGIMAAVMLSLAAQYPPEAATFYLLDSTPQDSNLSGVLETVTSRLPHTTNDISWRQVSDALGELAGEVHRRQETVQAGASAVYVFICGLQRYRMLRTAEDEMSFSLTDEETTTGPARQFGELLREGPPLGLHVVAWCDTPIALDRTLDRRALREFDHRVLFQLSAADSSNLIDSPIANKLGLYRAVAYSEEHGSLDKFRPYGIPDNTWLDSVQARMQTRLRQRQTSPGSG